jgi:hypothetical protein
MNTNLTLPEDLVFPKGIYHRHEIPVADYLMSLREKLTKDFLSGFDTLEQVVHARTERMLGYDWQAEAHQAKNVDLLRIETFDKETNQFKENLDSWRAVTLKYESRTADWANDLKFALEDVAPDLAKLHPTAYMLTKKYEKYCPISTYSVMAPRSVLRRHTGPENRTGKYIRIHIPLIIPEGDIFLEVNGEKVDWSDLFGFNNQLAHSSWNLSDEYRLVYIIDLDREFIGLPPGSLYDERLEKYASPFLEEEHYLERMEQLKK